MLNPRTEAELELELELGLNWKALDVGPICKRPNLEHIKYKD